MLVFNIGDIFMVSLYNVYIIIIKKLLHVIHQFNPIFNFTFIQS